MAELYFDLVVNGQMTIDQVPTRWRAEVEKLMKQRGITPAITETSKSAPTKSTFAHRA